MSGAIFANVLGFSILAVIAAGALAAFIWRGGLDLLAALILDAGEGGDEAAGEDARAATATALQGGESFHHEPGNSACPRQ